MALSVFTHLNHDYYLN